MGRKTTVTYLDDITGEETEDQDEINYIGILIDGCLYQLEVNEQTTEEFRELVASYLDRAAKLSEQKGEEHKYVEDAYDPQQGWLGYKHKPGAPSPASERQKQNAEIRDWWNNKGGRGEQDAIPNRGRIPKHVMEAWKAASNGNGEVKLTSVSTFAPDEE